MRKFSFRLESVLNLRKARESVLLAELAAARRALAAEKMALEQRKARSTYVLARARERRRSLQGNTEEGEVQRFLDVLEEEVQAQMRRVAEAQQQVDAKLSEVLEAMKERKALERLRERKLNDHVMQSAREDVRAMDEIGARTALQ